MRRLAFLFLLPTCTSWGPDRELLAQTPEVVTAVEGITEFKLENGMRVLLFPDPTKETVTVNNTIFVGSRHEGYGEAGMAHLLEHMVFQGTPTFSNVPKAIRDHGGGRTMNGTTWLDRTNYYETMPSSDENLEFGIKLEADRMVNSLIRAKDLESEMSVVRNEFESGENSPGNILRQRMTSAAFDWHNYGQSTIGNRADIERVPVENLRKFYKKYYQPDNAMLIISGSFHPQQAMKYVEQYFGALPKPTRVLEKTYTEEPTQDGERVVTLRRVGDVSMVGVAYHVVSGPHPDFAPVDIMATSLVQPSGRLYQALVETKLAASVGGGVMATHDPNLLMYVAQVGQGVDPDKVASVMIDVLENMAADPLTKEEVERSRARLLNDWERSFSESQRAAITLSDWASQGDWRLFFLYRDRVEAATVADAQRTAEAFLVTSNRTLGKFLPTADPKRATIAASPDVATMIGDYAGRAAVAVGESFDVTPKNIDARSVRSTLPGGIKVTALPKKTRGGTVDLRLTLRYGSTESLRDRALAAQLLGSMMMRGTESMSRQAIKDELNRYRAQMSVSSRGVGTLTASIQTKRENLVPMLNLLQDVLLNPEFSESEFETLKRQQLSQYTQQLSDPSAIAQLKLLRKIRPFQPGDPRYIPSTEEQIEIVKELTVDDVREIHTLIGGRHGELTIIGDFDPAEIQKIIQHTIKKLRGTVPYTRIPKPTIKVDGEYVEINTPDKANAMYFAGMVIPIRDDHPDYPALVIGNDIFGGGGALASRLGDRVRQKDGLSYGIGSMLQSSAHDDRTELMIYAISNPANAPKVKSAIREEFDRIRKDGITEEELEKSTASYIESRKVARTKDSGLAGLLGRNAEAGRTMKFAAEREEKIRKLSTEQVNAAIRKYLDPDKMVIVAAGDFGGKPKK
jgi:zinc protease